MMIEQGRIVLVCGLILAVFAGGVFAQDGDRGDPVKLSVSMSVEGTDNRDSNASEETNFDTYISPKIDIISDTERTIFDCFYSPSYRYRSDPHPTQNDDQFLHEAGLNVKHQLGLASRVRLKEQYFLTDDPAIQEGGTTLRRDSSYHMNTIMGGFTFDVGGEDTAADIMVQNNIKRYEEDLVARESDEDSTSVQLKVMHFLEPTLAVFGVGGVSDHGYDKTGNAKRGFQSYFGGLGVERILSDTIRFGIRAGGTSVEYDDSTVSSDSAPFVGCSLQVNPGAQTKVLLSGIYQLRDADVYPYASQEDTSFNLSAEWKGVDKVKLTFWGTYRIGSYDEASVPQSVLIAEGYANNAAGYMAQFGWNAEGEENTTVLGAKVDYILDEKMSVILSQTFEEIDSDVSTSFTRNATRVGLSRAF